MNITWPFCARTLLFLVVLVCSPGLLLAGDSTRIRVTADFSEADAVLAILAKRQTKQDVTNADWQVLFGTEPYQRLKRREASMQRTFTDDEFKNFVLGDDLFSRYADLRSTVAKWKQADLNVYATRILPYLPPESVIRAKVYPVIKPKHNSFVFEVDTDPAIFLYVDPTVSQESFANTVAHEMHHIGLSSVDKKYEQKIASLPDPAKVVAEWMGAFGEGEAMLAAAGGPNVDPVATGSQELKANWERGKRDFNQDLEQVNAFFVDVLNSKIKEDAIHEKAASFFGLQGPWYTVGYRMAVLVEKGYGRKGLIECMRDRRLLLERYNQVAEKSNHNGGPQLALWSPEILKAVEAPSSGTK
jgi:Putative zinc dependent peptidase (DUF5700)